MVLLFVTCEKEVRVATNAVFSCARRPVVFPVRNHVVEFCSERKAVSCSGVVSPAVGIA